MLATTTDFLHINSSSRFSSSPISNPHIQSSRSDIQIQSSTPNLISPHIQSSNPNLLSTPTSRPHIEAPHLKSTSDSPVFRATVKPNRCTALTTSHTSHIHLKFPTKSAINIIMGPSDRFVLNFAPIIGFLGLCLLSWHEHSWTLMAMWIFGCSPFLRVYRRMYRGEINEQQASRALLDLLSVFALYVVLAAVALIVLAAAFLEERYIGAYARHEKEAASPANTLARVHGNTTTAILSHQPPPRAYTSSILSMRHWRHFPRLERRLSVWRLLLWYLALL